MEKIPETAADISPYATSEFQTLPVSGGVGRSTMGRKETLRMTDYNKHKLTQPDSGSSARPNDGWRSGKMGKRPRRRYSESEEYDSDTDSERQDCIFWSQH